MGIYSKHVINEETNETGKLTKTFSDTFLYNRSSDIYEKDLINFIMKGVPINKDDPTFDNVVYDIKRRQIVESLVKVLRSNDTIIMNSEKRMPKAFTVFTAKDIKQKNKTKVFIYNDSIEHNESNSDYKLSNRNIDIFAAHLLDAATQIVYYAQPKRILLNHSIIEDGSFIFAKLFTNIIDFLFKIGNIGNEKGKVLYLSSMYYNVNILKKDITPSTRSLARRISGLTDREEKILLLQFNEEKGYVNIFEFISEIADTLKLSKLTIDTFIERWIFIYGTGTQFALELFPAFSAMITNAYIGCYINNQKTIEKITGRNMVTFSQSLLATIKGVI